MGYEYRKLMPYSSFGTLTSGASNAAGAWVFSANGMFDPDITGTGGQPMSFDSFMAFFNHYTVHACTMTVTFMCDSTTLRPTVGLFVSGSSTVTTDIGVLEQNGIGAKQIINIANAAQSMATFSCNLDVGRFQSVRQVMDDPNMRGDSASNPTEQAYFHLVCYNTGTTATCQVDWQIDMEFDATFHEPRKGSLSLGKPFCNHRSRPKTDPKFILRAEDDYEHLNQDVQRELKRSQEDEELLRKFHALQQSDVKKGYCPTS